jgi:hypothetical protein
MNEYILADVDRIGKFQASSSVFSVFSASKAFKHFTQRTPKEWKSVNLVGASAAADRAHAFA